MDNSDNIMQKLDALVEQQKDVAKSYNKVLETLLAESRLRQALLEHQTKVTKYLNVRSAAETIFMIIAIIVITCHLCGY